MADKLTKQNLEEFLNDHLQFSKTEILEEGKEKEDLYKIAEAKGIKVKGSMDLAIFKNIYAFADEANKNRVRLPEKQLLKALPTIVGKPINFEHNRKNVCGFYIDYSYKQKNKEAVTYGIFFKSNFAEEYEDMKEAFKKGKLNTSFEIWSPKDKRNHLDDGTVELNDMELAGGAILIKEEPAFAGAKVLDIAKKGNVELEGFSMDFASVNEEDIIVAELKKEESQVVAPIATPEVKIKLVDFKISCPSCGMSSWDVISEDDDKAEVKCSACSTEYDIEFRDNLMDTLGNFKVYKDGVVSCYQCGNRIPFSYISKANQEIDMNIQCDACGISFSLGTCEKKIKMVKNINKKETVKSEQELEGAKMEQPEVIDKPIEQPIETQVIENKEVIEVAKVEEPIIEVPKEEPVIAAEEPVVEPTIKIEVAKEEAIVEPIIEQTIEVAATCEEKEKYPKSKKLRKWASKVKKLVKANAQLTVEKENTAVALKNTAEKYSAFKSIVEEYEKALAGLKELEISKLQAKDLEIASIKQVALENAKKINERREVLKTVSSEMSDEQILNDKDFEIALLKQKNIELEVSNLNKSSSEVVGEKDRKKDSNLDDYYATFRKKVQSITF